MAVPSCLRIHICSALPYVCALKVVYLVPRPDLTFTTCPLLLTSTTYSACSFTFGNGGGGIVGCGDGVAARAAIPAQATSTMAMQAAILERSKVTGENGS